ncbi:MAG TPA: hypothetical protein VK530_14365 [Candidatus Acidoferrum sp.]|nr:hypothetical protein [Candidatus Acidoferrum sp.]
MKLLTRMSAFVILAIWLLAMNLCARECSSFEADDLCCPKATGKATEQPVSVPSNCFFASALTTKVQQDDQIHDLVSLPCVLASWLAADQLAASPTPLPAPKSAPPCLQSWQFLTRTALQPRAPSVVS